MALATLSPARRAAHAVVLRTLSDGAYADRALHGEARGLEPRDRALAKQLAFGTVQRRLTLDHVIAAHVDSRRGPAVFFRLKELRPGDKVYVPRSDGITATFTVTGVERYPKDAFPTQKVHGPTPDRALRLITCGGSFDYAKRSYRDNIVVYAVRTA